MLYRQQEGITLLKQCSDVWAASITFFQSEEKKDTLLVSISTMSIGSQALIRQFLHVVTLSGIMFIFGHPKTTKKNFRSELVPCGFNKPYFGPKDICKLS